MRIAHLIADGSPGGGTTFVLGLVNAMADDPAVEIHLITQESSFLLRCAQEAGVRVHGVNFFRSRLDPLVPRRLRSILGRIEPQVIHAHGGRAAFFLSFLPRSAVSARVVYTVHGYHFLHKPLPLRLLGALAERRASARADVTVFVSEGDRQIANDWNLLSPRATWQLIRNAIDASRLPMAVETDLKLVVFSGRLTKQKDPQLFVDLARELAGDGYRFLMLGSGELEGAVRERVRLQRLEPVLELRIGLERAPALDALRRAGACVMTSRWEGLPLVPLEAMAMGVPVIAPEIAGVTEIIESGVHGLLIAERDPRAYALAVRRLCEDGVTRSAMIAAARARVEQEFSYPRWVSAYRAVYGLPGS